MDVQLRTVEQSIVLDPEDLEQLRRYVNLLERTGFTHKGKSLSEWVKINEPGQAREELVNIGRPAIPYLIDKLQSDCPGERAAAAETLGQMDESIGIAVPWLRRGLSDAAFFVREACLGALFQSGEHSTATVKTIAGLLADPCESTRSRALWVLCQLREKASPALNTLMKFYCYSADSSARKKVLWLLSDFKEHAAPAVDQLRLIATTAPEEQRLLAIMVLGAVGASARRAVGALLTLLEDSYGRQHSFILRALSKIKGRQAALGLCRQLRRPESYKPQRIPRALEQIGHPAALPTLRRAFKSEDRTVRGAALKAIVALAPRDPKTLKIIDRALDDDYWKVQRIAIDGLQRFPKAMVSSLPKLRQLSTAGTATVRAAASQVIATSLS
jgi:HEAT repeat protein